ncbi:MAG: ABC transporter ATP-binding protein [Deltaproteobacteria bacterium]|nr:ABC transporter ATP-binding protein [Deltaproteobacteria bacterium]
MIADFEKVEGQGLTKIYGVTRALAGIDVSFGAGTVTVIKGPNGSGKSTLLALLGMLSKATRGIVRYGEFDASNAPSLRRRIGLMAHEAMVYPDLSGIENLLFVARLYSLDFPTRRVKQLRDRFALDLFAERPTRTYSRGQLQRLALARAVIHEPRLLLLDEPTTGLDSASVERLVSALEEEKKRGTISVLVTHDAGFAERLADRCYQLRRGSIVETA